MASERLDMMFVSSHLRYAPTKSLKPGAEGLSGMKADIPAETIVAALSAGQWWVYPIAHASDEVFYGLRLIPGVALETSPVVVARCALANTIVSRAAHFVPVRVLRYALSSDGRWDEIAAARAKDWKELVQFHHSLGGKDDLDDLRKILEDRSVKAKLRGSSFKATFPARLETFARLDPTPETVAYTNYLVKVVVEGRAPVPTPDAGCWNEALATLVLSRAREESQDDDPREHWAALRIVSQLPGIDARTDVVGELSEKDAMQIATSAAKVVTAAKDKAGLDPRLLTAVAKVATTKRYDGSAHLELASTLEKANAHADAFTAWMTAAFWQAQRKKDVGTAILDRARKLARKANWIDIADSLDEMHETRAEMISDGDWT